MLELTTLSIIITFLFKISCHNPTT